MFKNMHDLQAHHLLQLKGIDDCWFVPSPWPSPHWGKFLQVSKLVLVKHVLRLPLFVSWSCEHNVLNTQQLTFHMAKRKLG